MLRGIWAIACYLVALVCIALMALLYGIRMALLGWIACVFMSASLAIAVGREDEEDEEDID